MIPPPTDEDRALDLEAEYAASDRDAMRRALIRLAAAPGGMRRGALHEVTGVVFPDGDATFLFAGQEIYWRDA